MTARLPTAIAEAKGSYLTHKNRRPLNEPVADHPLGNAHPSMSKEEKKVWRDLVKQACSGVLKESDRVLFTVLVRLTNKLYTNQKLSAADIAQLISICSRFAMTPADRSKVVVEKAKSSSLSTFLDKKTA